MSEIPEISNIVSLINKFSSIGIKEFYIQYLQAGQWCEVIDFFDLAPMPEEYYMLVKQIESFNSGRISISMQIHPAMRYLANTNHWEGELIKFT